MLSAISLSCVLALVWFGAARMGRWAPRSSALLFGSPLPAVLMPPLATGVWHRVVLAAEGLGDTLRRVYTGSAQTYVLQALLYFLALTLLLALTAP